MRCIKQPSVKTTTSLPTFLFYFSSLEPKLWILKGKKKRRERRDKGKKKEDVWRRWNVSCHQTRGHYCFHVYTELHTLLEGISRAFARTRNMLPLKSSNRFRSLGRSERLWIKEIVKLSLTRSRSVSRFVNRYFNSAICLRFNST